MRYWKPTTRLLSPLFFILFFVILSCSDTGKKGSKQQQSPVKINQSSPASLLASIGKIIQKSRDDLLFRLYTPASVKAIKHNNQNGIGTAGTTDGLLREEIALHIARTSPPETRKPKSSHRPPKKNRPNTKKKKKNNKTVAFKKPIYTPPVIRNSQGGLLTVRWPSGNLSPIQFVKKKGKWLVDVLNGPGGNILLLKE